MEEMTVVEKNDDYESEMGMVLLIWKKLSANLFLYIMVWGLMALYQIKSVP